MSAAPASPRMMPPVAIGGVGGSGTRVFAELVRRHSVHIGEELNGPLDNLWFTVLFKRSGWSQGSPADPEEVARAVGLFYRAMTAGLRGGLADEDRQVLEELRTTLPPEGTWQSGATADNVTTLMNSGPQPGGAGKPWGWKEPNTHVFLPQLDRLIDGMRYVHVVRDGLDMAYAGKTWQVRHWSHLYDLPEDPDTPLPLRQLRFWTAANRRAIDYGTHAMTGRFLVVHYEDFCARPAPHIDRILDFLDLPRDMALSDDLVRPTSIGRSADRDLGLFPQADLDAARMVMARVRKIGQAGGT